AEAPLSAKRKPVPSGSSSESGKPVRDTAHQSLPSPDGGQPLPASRNVARNVTVDNNAARPDAPSDGIDIVTSIARGAEKCSGVPDPMKIRPKIGLDCLAGAIAGN